MVLGFLTINHCKLSRAYTRDFLTCSSCSYYNSMVKHGHFRNSLFLSTVVEWHKLNNNIRNSEPVSAFKSDSLNLSDQVLIARLMCIILMELNYLEDYELGNLREHESRQFSRLPRLISQLRSAY